MSTGKTSLREFGRRLTAFAVKNYDDEIVGLELLTALLMLMTQEGDLPPDEDAHIIDTRLRSTCTDEVLNDHDFMDFVVDQMMTYLKNNMRAFPEDMTRYTTDEDDDSVTNFISTEMSTEKAVKKYNP